MAAVARVVRLASVLPFAISAGCFGGVSVVVGGNRERWERVDRSKRGARKERREDWRDEVGMCTFVAFLGGTGQCALGGLADLVECIPKRWIQ